MPLSTTLQNALSRAQASFERSQVINLEKAATADALAVAQQNDLAKADEVATAQESLKNDTKDLYAAIALEFGVPLS